jgi:hypothetical protein
LVHAMEKTCGIGGTLNALATRTLLAAHDFVFRFRFCSERVPGSMPAKLLLHA